MTYLQFQNAHGFNLGRYLLSLLHKKSHGNTYLSPYLKGISQIRSLLKHVLDPLSLYKKYITTFITRFNINITVYKYILPSTKNIAIWQLLHTELSTLSLRLL